MDLHDNLYYSYRGAATSDVDRDKQLENNLTKSLINTLSLGGEEVWQPFLRSLGIADPKDAMFLLQRRDLPSSPATMTKRVGFGPTGLGKSAWGIALVSTAVPRFTLKGPRRPARWNPFRVRVETGHQPGAAFIRIREIGRAHV